MPLQIRRQTKTGSASVGQLIYQYHCQKLSFGIHSQCMKMGENSKIKNHPMKHKMHLSLQLLGLVGN